MANPTQQFVTFGLTKETAFLLVVAVQREIARADGRAIGGPDLSVRDCESLSRLRAHLLSALRAMGMPDASFPANS